MELAVLEKNAVGREAPYDLVLKRSQRLDAGADANPEDAGCTACGKHTATAEDDVEGRRVDVLRHGVDKQGCDIRLDLTEEHERQMGALGGDPLQGPGCRSE